MINKETNRQLILKVKQAGFESISDMMVKTSRTRRFILKGHKITEMLLDERCEKRVLKAQITLHDEILDRKDKEIADLKAKIQALEIEKAKLISGLTIPVVNASRKKIEAGSLVRKV